MEGNLNGTDYVEFAEPAHELREIASQVAHLRENLPEAGAVARSLMGLTDRLNRLEVGFQQMSAQRHSADQQLLLQARHSALDLAIKAVGQTTDPGAITGVAAGFLEWLLQGPQLQRAPDGMTH